MELARSGLLRSVTRVESLGRRMLRIFQRRIIRLARRPRWRSRRILRRDRGLFQGRILGRIKRESLARALGWIGGCLAHEKLLLHSGIARHEVQAKQCARSVCSCTGDLQGISALGRIVHRAGWSRASVVHRPPTRRYRRGLDHPCRSRQSQTTSVQKPDHRKDFAHGTHTANRAERWPPDTADRAWHLAAQ